MVTRRWMMSLGAMLALVAMPTYGTADMIGVDAVQGRVYRIDEITGDAIILRLTGPAFNSLARDSSGRLYAVSFVQSLNTINPTTGASTFIAPLSPPADIRALAFSSTDVLFGIRDGGTVQSPDDLVTINVSTGDVTLVANTGVPGLQALAFSPEGTLYGWEGVGLGLVTINPLTGMVTDVNPAIGGSGEVQGLAFAPDGTLYGARSALYTINLETGALTFVGTNSYTDLRGIEFVPVPEPSTLILLGLGILGLTGVAWGQRKWMWSTMVAAEPNAAPDRSRP